MVDKNEEIVHFHSWYVQPQDTSCERCNCGAILVSQREYDRRQEEWNQYYQACQTTKAFSVLEEMKAAIKPAYGKDSTVEIKRVRDKISTLTHKERNADGDIILVPNETEIEQFRPHFPEPEGFRNYIVEAPA